VGAALAITLGLETGTALGVTAFGAGAALGWTLAIGLATGFVDLAATGFAALTGAFATCFDKDLTGGLTADFALEAPGFAFGAVLATLPLAGLAETFGLATGFALAGAAFLATAIGFLALAALLAFTGVFGLGAGFPLAGAFATAFLGAAFLAGLAFLGAGFADLVFF